MAINGKQLYFQNKASNQCGNKSFRNAIKLLSTNKCIITKDDTVFEEYEICINNEQNISESFKSRCIKIVEKLEGETTFLQKPK